MSQPATERETRPQPGRQGQGQGLSKKIGPLPAWGWAALAGGAALIWYVWRQRSKSQQATDTANAALAAGPIAGTACTDAAGNPGFISANGGCDTSLSGTGLPGGGQDLALLAQIRALQGEISTLQEEQGETPGQEEEESETRAQEAAEHIIREPGPCPRGYRRVRGRCVPVHVTGPQPRPRPRPRPRGRGGGGPGPEPRPRTRGGGGGA